MTDPTTWFPVKDHADAGDRASDRQTPKRLAVHLIADNYDTHKHAKVQAWLKRHPRRFSA